MKKFGRNNKPDSTSETTKIHFSDTPFATTGRHEKPLLPAFATKEVDQIQLIANTNRLGQIKKVLAPYVEDMLSFQHPQEIATAYFGKLGLLYEEFGLYLKYNSSLNLSIEEFRILIQEIQPEVIQHFDKEDGKHVDALLAHVANKIHYIRRLFDEWFNRTNLQIFIDEKKMKSTEIFKAFQDVYGAPDAPWEIISIREGEFVSIFKDYIESLYGKIVE